MRLTQWSVACGRSAGSRGSWGTQSGSGQSDVIGCAPYTSDSSTPPNTKVTSPAPSPILMVDGSPTRVRSAADPTMSIDITTMEHPTNLVVR